MGKVSFNEGDKVRHKNGGPVMVVQNETGSFVSCLVLSEHGRLAQKLLPASELVLAEDDAFHYTQGGSTDSHA